MEIYFLVIFSICLLASILTLYLKKIRLEEYKYTLVITTHNCASICEGVLRIALGFANKMGNHQIVVVDMQSSDETFEILKRLSSKYLFPLFRTTDKHYSSHGNLADTDSLSKYNVLVLNKNTTYFSANTQMDRIRHSSTYNTSFH